MARQRVEVLVFEGCPNAAAAADRARAALRLVAVDAELDVVVVRSDEDAQRLRFLGSPSVRVDGTDVDVSARTRSDFGLQCRIYAMDDRVLGTPPIEWIVEALRPSAWPGDTT